VLSIRAAASSDVDSITGLVREAVEWLGKRGTEQWQGPRFGDRARIAASIAAGTTFVILDGDLVVGTVIVDEAADPEFWTEEDEPGSALYVHRMVVAHSHRGTGLGSAVLDWAGRRAMDAGKSRLRLDAWASNQALHDYYRSQGFKHLRTLCFEHRGSGALFEREAGVQLGHGPELVEEVSAN